MQRERFFDADAFSRFYRDNTMSEEIERLRHDMYHGADVHRANHADSLSRVDAVMMQAANVQPAGA
jgi:erythromycin esterase-like protein